MTIKKMLFYLNFRTVVNGQVGGKKKQVSNCFDTCKNFILLLYAIRKTSGTMGKMPFLTLSRPRKPA